MHVHPGMTVGAFAAQLAPVLGNEQALSMVHGAVKELGYVGGMLQAAEQRAVLLVLGRRSGVIGAAARHILRRFDAVARGGTASTPCGAPPVVSARSVPPGASVSRADLSAAFERAVGAERARELVDVACRARRVGEDPVRLETAEQVLEDLARVPGMVGVVARFAKARLVLRRPASV